jgi:CheY-like chemotaxis protein
VIIGAFMLQTRKTVLLVDEDGDDREFFAEIIKTVDSTVTYEMAWNGESAFDILGKWLPKTPDFILLELFMPVMDGFEFLRLLKMEELYKDIPVVVFTAAPNSAMKCYELGACLYVTKPTKLHPYRQLITSLLGRDMTQDCEDLRRKYAQAN